MGHVHIIRDFHSLPEGAVRTVRIYTPDVYDSEPGRRFGVLYMNDGQNVFAHPESSRMETWCANWAIERVAREGRTEPWIIVGVDHDVDRFAQYSPWDEPRLGIEARGPHYIRFLAEHLKPYIDRTYRTKPQSHSTGIMGSSLGGLISLYAGLARPDVFGRIGGVSPSTMWSLGHLFDAWKEHSRRWTRIYLDVGEHERIFRDHVPLNYADSVPDFYRHLKYLGYGDHEVRLVVDPLGGHHELDWQRRLPDGFAWLLAS